MKAYRIYGREGSSKFRALDVGAGAFAGNLIHATLFYSEREVKRVCEELRKVNPDFEFQVRTVRNA